MCPYPNDLGKISYGDEDSIDFEHPHFGEHVRAGEQIQLPLNAAEMRWLLLEMARCQTLDELFDLVSASFGSLQDVALARIWLLEAPGDACRACSDAPDCIDHSRCLRLVSSAGRSVAGGPSLTSIEGRHKRFPLGIRKVGLIASTGAPFHLQGVMADMDWISDPDWIQREGIRSFLGQPLIYKKEVLGVFAVFSRGNHGQYVMERLRMVADHLAIAIANARAFETLERLKRRLEIENDYLRQSSALDQCLTGLVGESPALRRIKEQILQVAPTNAVVLITGESGTGKEMVAAEVHRQSRVADGPLVKVNCPSIPAELFESEFFGHVKGAFTGATAARIGFFEAANNGTLFLDEIGEIPLQLQSKLLRVLQESEYHRVGEERSRTLHTRVVAATNRNLAQMIAEGRFREDLYYRLNVFPIETPPLRERREDIPLLAESFLVQCAKDLERPGLRLRSDQLDILIRYDWPGNIRELQNVIRRAAITAKGSSVDLRFLQLQADQPALKPLGTRQDTDAVLTEEAMLLFEKHNISNALRRCNGKIYGDNGAAALLGIRPTTLVSRMTKFGISKMGDK